MATVSTIGTAARNYSTVAAWLVAFAAGGWEGECYNDSEFVVTATISFSGHAVSAPNYIKLSAAAGQGFRDNANALTNALRYNPANGAAIKTTTRYINTITVAENFVTIFGLQIGQLSVGTGGGAQPYNQNSGATSNVLDSCICENLSGTGSIAVIRSNAGTIKNVLAIQRGTAGDGINFGYPSGTVTAFNCTAVRPSDIAAAGNVFLSAAGNWKAVNCAGFGFSTFNSGGTPTSCSNNASDLAIGIGSANQASKTYANQFVTTTDAARDFRSKAAADLLENATATGAPVVDIIGTSRPQGTLPDIGVWELAGGNVYSVSMTEAGSAAETVSSSATLVAARVEAGSAADSPSSVAVLPAAIAEAPSAADSPSSSATLPGAVGEAGSAADSPSSVAVLPAAIGEAASAQDTDSQGGAVSAIVEAASAVDTVSSTLVGVAAVTEAGAASDTRSSAAILPAAVAEAVSAVDVLSAKATFMAALVEAGIALDLENAQAIMVGGIAEAAAAQDFPSANAPTVAASRCNTLGTAPRVRVLGTAPRVRVLGVECC